MKKTLAMIAALVAAPVSLTAQDFSEGSKAKSWNLFGEVPAKFEAKVVDILCELSGDCPNNCGDGNRQLGLVRSADNVLVYPNKNSQTGFQGATADLLPHCAQTIEVDGMLIEDPDLGAQNVYLLQLIKPAGSDEWIKANTWSKRWAEKHPEAKGKGPWFRRDPRVKAEIEREGYFGLGLEQDEAIKDVVFE